MRDDQELARRGLTLPRETLMHFRSLGIFAAPSVTLEYQHMIEKYVVRGTESGGAAGNVGRFVTFCAPDGTALPCLHPVDTITVNGLHAVVVAACLVRIEIFRVGRTYQVLITRHRPGKSELRRRPQIESEVRFRGLHGCMAAKGSCGNDRHPRIPKFWSRSGEEVQVPLMFTDAVIAGVQGANCLGCAHVHYLGEALP